MSSICTLWRWQCQGIRNCRIPCRLRSDSRLHSWPIGTSYPRRLFCHCLGRSISIRTMCIQNLHFQNSTTNWRWDTHNFLQSNLWSGMIDHQYLDNHNLSIEHIIRIHQFYSKSCQSRVRILNPQLHLNLFLPSRIFFSSFSPEKCSRRNILHIRMFQRPSWPRSCWMKDVRIKNQCRFALYPHLGISVAHKLQLLRYYWLCKSLDQLRKQVLSSCILFLFTLDQDNKI